MSNKLTRRHFLAAAATAGAGLTLNTAHGASEKPVLLGGKPVRTKAFPSWPVWDKTEEKALLDVLNSGKWFRGGGQIVTQFEEEYAKLMGAKSCLATANGTSALLTSLAVLGVQAGDEVILPPYTFVACVNVVLMLNALPVFVDTDPETFQIDARKIEAAITDRTAAIMPVHLGGNVADLDTILPVAKKHKIPVVEDACQSHLAEWKKRKAGTYGETGCFSFQITKNLNAGEGGAILSNDEDLIERCYAFHSNSRGRKTTGYDFKYVARGANFRMTEFQGALLLAQMTRIEQQARTRTENAQYLSNMLLEIPGIQPVRMYEGCTRNAYHLYMFRYKKENFANIPKKTFVRALDKEGIPTSVGYGPLNKEPFIKNTITSRGYEALFSKERLARWEEQNNCPANDRLCADEGVWFAQTMLLGPRSDMDDIAAAIRKIHAHAGELAKT